MKDKNIIIIVAGAIVFFLGFVAHIQYFRLRDQFIDLYKDKQEVLTRQAALNLEAFINERLKAIEVLAQMSATKPDQAEIFSEYQRVFQIVKGFEYILFVDETGKAIAGYPENHPCPSRLPDSLKIGYFSAFESARLNRKIIVHSRDVVDNDRVLVCLIAPIFTEDLTFRGAVTGILNVQKSIEAALEPIITGTQDYVWVLNANGFLMYHPHHNMSLMGNILHVKGQCFDCHQNFEFEREIMTRQTGVEIKSIFNNPAQLVGFATVPLENTSWLVVVNSPFRQIKTLIRSQFKHMLLLILFMMGTVIIGAVLINQINKTRITARKELENIKVQKALIKEKKAVESRYRILVEQSPDPIFLFTRRKFILVNASFETFFGYRGAEIYGGKLKFIGLVDAEYVHRFESEMKKFIKGKKQLTAISTAMRNSSGAFLEVQISFSRFRMGGAIVYQGVLHDVTKIKQLEREQEQRKHLSMIGEMSARIAHEIKNPLASIQTGIQLLESTVTANDPQKSYYERLRREIQRVDSILKGLLSYARHDSLSKKSVQIETLLNRFQRLILPTLKKHQLKLVVDLEPNLPSIEIDDQKMEQVLWNICLNAIQASPAGEKILIKVSSNNDSLLLKIEDHGCGIAEENLKKIFYPFFSTRTHGTGLGLAISRKIVEQHQGKLEIKTKQNVGTTVSIYLPKAEVIS
ncbi:MAG: ATP-binding protein [bacterium]|nr:ATP-binding protein [bacterium]